MTNYRFVIAYSPEREVYVARAPELEQCEAEAPTRAEALARLEEEVGARLENIEAQEAEPPPPVTERELDGELTIKISPELHQELAFLAEYDKVELPILLTELLTRAVSYRWTGGRGRGRKRDHQRGRGGRNREGQGQRYHDIMENRADFIEYVRRQESGGGGRGGRGGGGGRGRGRGRR